MYMCMYVYECMGVFAYACVYMYVCVCFSCALFVLVDLFWFLVLGFPWFGLVWFDVFNDNMELYG